MRELTVWTSETTPVELPVNVRVKWVYDEEYSTVGSYSYNTEEETREAERNETSRLDSGEWVALGCIIEDDKGEQIDSLWGIVIEPHEDKLAQFFTDQMEVPSEIQIAEDRLARAQAAVKFAIQAVIDAHVRDAVKGSE